MLRQVQQAWEAREAPGWQEQQQQCAWYPMLIRLRQAWLGLVQQVLGQQPWREQLRSQQLGRVNWVSMMRMSKSEGLELQQELQQLACSRPAAVLG